MWSWQTWTFFKRLKRTGLKSKKKQEGSVFIKDKEQEKRSRKEEMVTLQILLITQVRYTQRSDHWLGVYGGIRDGRGNGTTQWVENGMKREKVKNRHCRLLSRSSSLKCQRDEVRGLPEQDAELRLLSHQRRDAGLMRHLLCPVRLSLFTSDTRIMSILQKRCCENETRFCTWQALGDNGH